MSCVITESIHMKVSVCLHSDALSQCLPSYLGFSYLGHGVSLHSCSSKIFLFGRKGMTNLDSILKSRDTTKIHLVKAMVFPVVMYGCERWTIKKAECRRIDAFDLGCWRRLLRVPWTAKRFNQSILKEINWKN